MAMVRFDPFRSFEGLVKKMNDMYEDAEKGNFSIEYGAFSPRVDITEDDKSIYIFAEMPGVKKEDVKVKISDNNFLNIIGEKRSYDHEKKSDDNQENQRTFIRVERSFGSFARKFMLPENIDEDSIKAKFENGVLEVSLNKKEPEKPKEKIVDIK